MPTADFVDVGGAMIATRVLEPAGSSAGDVVLCHGTPWSSQVWRTVAATLSRGYRVFLWDMPGYGASAKTPGIPLDLRTQGRRLAELIAAWGLDRPHVVAHDVGGAVALGAHLREGVDFTDLFLWDIVTLDPWGSPFFRLVATHAEVFAQLPPALHAALVREYISGAVAHGLPEATIAELARPWLDPDGHRLDPDGHRLDPDGQSAFYQQIAALDPEDTRPLADRLETVRCPVRIGWGVEDPWIPLEQAYELQRRIPGTPRVVELAGVSHLAPVERPEEVSAALLAWFAESQQS